MNVDNQDQSPANINNIGGTNGSNNQAALPGNAGHAEDQGNIAGSQNGNQAPNEDYVEKYKRLEGKISGIETEKTQLKESYNAVSSWVYEDKDRLKSFLISKGFNEDYANAQIQKMQDENPELAEKWGPKDQGAKNDQGKIDPSLIDRMVQKKLADYDRRLESKQIGSEADQAVAKMQVLYPELTKSSLEKLPSDQAQKIRELTEVVDDMALTMRRKGIPMEEAYQKSISAVYGLPARSIEDIQRNQKNSANISRLGVFATPSANRGGENAGGLTEVERRIAAAGSMTEADYAKYKSNPQDDVY